MDASLKDEHAGHMLPEGQILSQIISVPTQGTGHLRCIQGNHKRVIPGML